MERELNVPLDTIEGRVAWMNSHDAGIWEGTTKDGQTCRIFNQPGAGMTVKLLNSKDWWECIDYDKDGYRECEYVEPFSL